MRRERFKCWEPRLPWQGLELLWKYHPCNGAGQRTAMAEEAVVSWDPTTAYRNQLHQTHGFKFYAARGRHSKFSSPVLGYLISMNKSFPSEEASCQRKRRYVEGVKRTAQKAPMLRVILSKLTQMRDFWF